jgi:YidC/Oxa1 family membrane protein insertase
MKFVAGFLPILLALLEVNVGAFAPASFSGAARQSTARAFSPIDASNLHELPHHVQSIQDFMSTLSVADLDADAVAAGATEVTEAAAKSGNGWFGFLTGPTEAFLQLIHDVFVGVGLESNSWGISIIALTLTIKLLTFPLTKAQLESTQKMQALQPTLKGIQAKYQSNPEVMNQKIAELYQTNNVNPLAGCIPSIVQIPVFIGLYRAVLDLANENALDEAFLWLPSLEGPTYGVDPSKGSAWLFDNWVNGAPSLGWETTAAFLVLPIFLVISQFASMEIMTPKEQKETQPAFLKVLPLMIGWFSLSVPSALSVYWVTNNIVTTATSLIIRNSLKTDTATVAVASESTAAAAAAAPANPNVFTPPTIREKPEGFGSSTGPSSAGVTPITNADVVDAEVVSEIVSNSEEVVGEQATKKRGSNKKKKKRRKN